MLSYIPGRKGIDKENCALNESFTPWSKQAWRLKDGQAVTLVCSTRFPSLFRPHVYEVQPFSLVVLT